MADKVKTRMAPSPTGFLHVGGLRTALYDYLFARKMNGKFVLRIEDTDQSRLVDGALENIVQSLHDFKIEADEGFYWDAGAKERGDHAPYQQSKRLQIYLDHAQKLIDSKAAYYCFCSQERLEELRKSHEAQKLPPKYDKHCLGLSEKEVGEKFVNKIPYVVRLNVPEGRTITFSDEVHGEISIATRDIDDQVLLKSDGFPTYHLAVVVDDYLMEVTHVIRGDEWIPSTPKHILLYEAFGWKPPVWVHLPLLLSKTRKKLSKRDGDVAVKDFLTQGYLPEALLNFVALLGWNPKTEQEIFSLDELVENFDLKKINKAGAVFDLDKLDWINGMYIRQMDSEALLGKVTPNLAAYGVEKFPKEFLLKIIKLEQDRLKKFSEIGERLRYFFETPEYDTEKLIWKKSDKEIIKNNLTATLTFLNDFDQNKFTAAELESEIKKYIAAGNLKTGEVLWPLRVALTGLDASPGPFEIMDAFGSLPNGKEIILQRIEAAVNKL